MSGLLDKVKAKVNDLTSDNRNTTTTGTTAGASTTAGPHSSNLANEADPRVDSNLDGRSGLGSTNTTGTGYSNAGAGYSNTTGSGYSGATGTTGTGYSGTSGIGSSGANTTYTGTSGTSGNTTAGPHSSDLLNKLDPRVDSDRSGTTGGYSSTNTARTGNTTAYTQGGFPVDSSTTAGPHSSNLANKLDPRVDSNLDGSRTTGGNQTTSYGSGAGTGGAYSSSGYSSNTTTGPHSSSIANKLDPRVDSDLDGSRNLGANQTTSYGSGAAAGGAYSSSGYSGNTTAGPHSSSIANKLDPRVDSDLDGSRNLGANQTTQTTGHHHHSHHGHHGHHNTTGTTAVGTGSGAGYNTSTGAGYSTGTGAGYSTGTGAGYGTSSGQPTANNPTSQPLHNNQTMNELDPRVDTTSSYSGNAGPVHNSSILNKLDPRVDTSATSQTNPNTNANLGGSRY